MYLCRTEDYFKVLDENRALSLCIEETEKKVFGFDYQKLGAEVLKCWGIPDNICESIRYHHHYKDIPKKLQSDSNLLLLSDKMSYSQ